MIATIEGEIGPVHLLLETDIVDRYYTCNSRWSSWGRWVALAVIVIAAIILFFMIAYDQCKLSDQH